MPDNNKIKTNTDNNILTDGNEISTCCCDGDGSVPCNDPLFVPPACIEVTYEVVNETQGCICVDSAHIATKYNFDTPPPRGTFLYTQDPSITSQYNYKSPVSIGGEYCDSIFAPLTFELTSQIGYVSLNCNHPYPGDWDSYAYGMTIEYSTFGVETEGAENLDEILYWSKDQFDDPLAVNWHLWGDQCPIGPTPIAPENRGYREQFYGKLILESGETYVSWPYLSCNCGLPAMQYRISWEPADCPVEDPTGACCVDGNCTIETYAVCTGMLGAYKGHGVACDGINCNEFDDIGACCKPDGSCEDTTRIDCFYQGGTSFTANVACTFVVCPVVATGACCQDNYDWCAINTQTACDALGDDYTWLGPGSDCTIDCTAPPAFSAGDFF